MRGAGLRSRWPRGQVAFALVGVILAGGAAAIVNWPHAWWWLIVVIAVAAAVMPPALAALSHALRRRHEIGQAARSGLQGTTGATGDKLPAAGAADLEARVHQTILPIRYIHRDEEETIRAHLRARRPVLLIGSSMVGKTKMAARVIADEFGFWPVAIPDSKTAMADLDAKDVTLQDSVIWLDDIDRLIGPGGITDGALRRLATSGNVIVGTIRAKAYDQLRPSDQLRLPEWDVLCLFEHVFIRRDLSRREQERLAEVVSDPDIRDRIRTVGLGEYVGAAWQVAEALELGAAGADPVGYALVLAAADWRRCGMTRPIPASLLAPMARPYLDSRSQARGDNQKIFNAGLAWATRDINPNVALLQPAGTDSYSVYEYALDLISAQSRPIPDSSWTLIMADAEALELIRIGYAAFTYSRDEIATQAFLKAVNSEDVETANQASFSLAVVLKEQGDMTGAKKAYQKATHSADLGTAGLAALSLGILLQGEGDLPGAKEAFQKAIKSGQENSAPLAMFGLGWLLKEQGDLPGAKEAFQKAIKSGYPAATALGAVGVAMMLTDEGDKTSAMEAWDDAIDRLERARRWLEDQGDVPGMEKAFQEILSLEGELKDEDRRKA